MSDEKLPEWEDGSLTDCPHTHHGAITLCEAEMRRRSDAYPKLVQRASKLRSVLVAANETARRRGAQRDEARDALRRAAFVAEHLWQMVDRDTWRDSGAFAEGIYEGEVRADEVRQEIEGWKKLAGGASTTETAKPSNQELAAAMYKLRLDDPLGHYFSQAQTRALVARVEALLAERDALEAQRDAAEKLLDDFFAETEQLKGRVAVLEAALRETRETIWRVSQYDRIVIGYAGELQEAALSLDAVLAAGDASPHTDNPGGDEVASSGGGS